MTDIPGTTDASFGKLDTREKKEREGERVWCKESDSNVFLVLYIIKQEESLSVINFLIQV